MSTRTVSTQTELDQALADPDITLILINSPRGVWLHLSSSGSATVEAYGSATVRAYDSATVEAYGSATVEAYDSATVEAYGSATVRAYGSATVEAYGSATVEAYGSATVRAYDSATVRAYDSATVRAATHVAVHLNSARATVTGGVVIDITALDLNDATTWCSYHGVDVAAVEDRTFAVLYKAVDENLQAGHQYNVVTDYPIGSEVTCVDWRDDNACGGGLHVSPRTDQAASYRDSRTTIRYLRVHVPIDRLRPISADKCKTPTLTVIAEVDEFGRELTVAASGGAS